MAKTKPAKATKIDPSIIARDVIEKASELPTQKFKHSKNLEIVGSIKGESEITWFVTSNPRSKGRGTFDRFAAYLGTKTVTDYFAAGGTLGDLRWDIRSGYLAVDGVTLGGELEPRAAKAPKAAKEPKPAKESKPKRVKAAKTVEAVEVENELAAATVEETID